MSIIYQASKETKEKGEETRESAIIVDIFATELKDLYY